MTEAGLSVGTDQVAQGYFTYRSGLEAAEKLLDGVQSHRDLRLQ